MLSIADTNYDFNDLIISTNTISHTITDGQIDLIRHIKINCNGKTIFESDYDECGPYFELDFTWYEVEDFDFGLFLENLSKDKEWSERFFTDM